MASGCGDEGVGRLGRALRTPCTQYFSFCRTILEPRAYALNKLRVLRVDKARPSRPSRPTRMRSANR
jgi:hypothetical protein